MHIDVTAKNTPFFEAFASETRIKIIEMLDEKPMNIGDIAAALGISSAIVTKHVQKLEEAGIIRCESSAGKRGSQKICFLNIDQVVLNFRTRKKDNNYYSVAIPVGQYSSYNIKPTCGLASTEKRLGIFDDPRYFASPEHVNAAILWYGSGWVEYRIPNYLLKTQVCSSIEISVEICSEAPHYNEAWPSDISFLINGVKIGEWTSPGDFGKSKGVFTPSWWKSGTTHGLLKTIIVNNSGSFIDGIKMSDITISDISITCSKEITFRVANYENAGNVGGVTLFGRGFGNYDQDIQVVLSYLPNAG